MEFYFSQQHGMTARQFIEQQFELFGIKEADDVLDFIKLHENAEIITDIAEAIDGPDFGQHCISGVRNMIAGSTLKAA